MPTVTPTAVTGPRKWSGAYGENEDWTLTIPGYDKPVILSQKAGKDAPNVNEAIELEIEPHPRFEDKLKGKRPQMGGGFGVPRPEDPKRAARILRQHSQHMSLQAIELGIRHKIIDPPADGPALFALLKKTADWFDRDAEEAAK